MLKISFQKRRDEPVPSPIALTYVDRFPTPGKTKPLPTQGEPITATSPLCLSILPPEIRELIYRFYFLSAIENGATCPVGIDRRKLSYNHAHSFSGIHIAYPPLLHTNRIIRLEAAKCFFALMTFDMRFPLLPHRGCCRLFGYQHNERTCLLRHKDHTRGLGCLHNQCCSFPTHEDYVRGILLSEPLSISSASLIRSVSLDVEALCPKVFLILNRCCPALKSLNINVGKSVTDGNSLTGIPREWTYYSSLLHVGLTYLPGLTFLGLHLALWRHSLAEDDVNLQKVYHTLHQLCECLRERYSGASSREWNDLSCEVIPIHVEPRAINVWGATKASERHRQTLKRPGDPQTPTDPFDDTPDSWY